MLGAVGVGVLILVVAIVVMMGKKGDANEDGAPAPTGDYSNAGASGGPTGPAKPTPPPPPTREEMAEVDRVWDRVRPDVKEMLALFEEGAKYIHEDRPKMERLFHQANAIWTRIDSETRKALDPFQARYTGEYEELLERYFDRQISERAKWFSAAGEYKKMMGR